jgi:transcription antitermination factor NusG
MFHFLREIDGISGVVMSGLAPAMNNRLDDTIENWMRSEDENGYVGGPEVKELAKMSVNDRVIVLRGLFHGADGVCEEVRGTRVRVLLGGVSVWHSESDLARVSVNNQ